MEPIASSRRVEPEWLDELAADDPRAVGSRIDIGRINMIMRHAGLLAHALGHNAECTPRVIADLGSSDGAFMLAVARRLAPRWRNVTVRLVDRADVVAPRTRRAFAALGWRAEPVAADLIDYLESDESSADAIMANLVLHHFDAAELTLVLRLAARRTPLFVACEPWRAHHSLLFSKMLWAIGCNDVTRHDAPTSVRAGFRPRELSALWPEHANWHLQEGVALPFSHRFVARRL